MADRKSPSPAVRLLILAWIALYIAWYWISPWLLLHHLNKPNGSAWVQLLMLPTLIAGGAAGVVALVSPRLATVLIFAVFTVAHGVLGLDLMH